MRWWAPLTLVVSPSSSVRRHGRRFWEEIGGLEAVVGLELYYAKSGARRGHGAGSCGGSHRRRKSPATTPGSLGGGSEVLQRVREMEEWRSGEGVSQIRMELTFPDMKAILLFSGVTIE